MSGSSGTRTHSTRTTTARALVAGAVLLALAGCADRGAPASTPSPTSPSTATSTAPAGLTGELTVFAAASLHGPLDDLLSQLADENPGVTVHPPTYDTSSAVASRLVAGAAADSVAAAQDDVTTVADAGLVAGTPTVFASDALVIVVPAGNPKNIATLHDLGVLSDSGGKVVFCVATVPCGSAAHKVLDTSGVGVAASSNEPDVDAVLAKVQSGEADAGLVYRSTAHGAGAAVQAVEFPESAAAVLTYSVAVLSGATSAEVAAAFVDLVTGPEGKAALEAAGFVVP